MCKAVIVAAWVMMWPLATTPQMAETGAWKGKYAIFQYNLLYGTDVQDQNRVSRSMELREFDYDLFQNDSGIAREDLTHMNTNRGLEGPLDVRLLDYGHGYGRVWDKGGTQLVEGPLDPLVPGKSIGTRQILGFACEGREYEWTTFQHATVQLESWSAKDSTFKVPLLQVQHFTDNAGDLLGITVDVVTQLEPASELPASLFVAPEGLKVVKVHSIE